MNGCAGEVSITGIDAYRSPIFLAAGVVYVGKVFARRERIPVDCGYAFRYRYTRKACAIREGRRIDISYAFRDRYASKACSIR